MKISIVMIDGSFREKFHCVDSFLAQDFPKDEYEILWVEYYDSVNSELRSKECDNFKIITLDNAKSKEYHSSFCFNGGLKEAKGELVVIPDADVLVEKYFLESLWKEHLQCDNLVMYIHRLNEFMKDHDPQKSYDFEFLKKNVNLNFSSNFGGCVTAKKKWFEKINGYDQSEVFSSNYHSNGTDVNVRFKNFGMHIMWHPSLYLYHPWHIYPDGMSDKTIMQLRLTDRRRFTLDYLPNEGLDTSLNKDEPDALTKKELRDVFIKHNIRYSARKIVRILGKIKSLIKSVFRV